MEQKHQPANGERKSVSDFKIDQIIYVISSIHKITWVRIWKKLKEEKLDLVETMISPGWLSQKYTDKR